MTKTGHWIADQSSQTEPARLIGEHDRAPPQIVVEQQPAHIVDIVAIAVVGGIGGNDRLQRRRTAGGYLQPVEPTPALAHHADIAVAPGLLRDPRDDLDRVVLFLLDIFVGHVAVGFAGSAHVHADGGVAVFSEIAMHGLVAAARAVALAIRNIFEHGGNRILFGALRQPEARTKARSVAHGDPQMLGDMYGHGRFQYVRMRKVRRGAAATPADQPAARILRISSSQSRRSSGTEVMSCSV